ncbi:MAG: hypothetical protein SPJ52_00690 [Candidatus Enterosoma sp.]|nr:hypothetical protein [Bacilli bacterium]MDD7607493.1 hypothetical protein [bacterium]MDY5865660.1 hypothetical protein [Candidatus Enterosoma sp.]
MALGEDLFADALYVFCNRTKNPIKVDPGKWDVIMKLWGSGDITAVEAMRRLGLKRNTFYRRVKKSKEG